MICPKPPAPAGKILDRRQLFFLANHNSPEQTPHTRLNLNVVVGWSIKDNKRNCRVSFINLYFVFSRNFRIVFLPHTNTVILPLEFYWNRTVVLSKSLDYLWAYPGLIHYILLIFRLEHDATRWCQ